MIRFDDKYQAIRGFPGYFWNDREEALYSIKIQGVMRRLTERKPNRWNRMSLPFYELSLNGQRKYLTVYRIKSKLMKDYVIL